MKAPLCTTQDVILDGSHSWRLAARARQRLSRCTHVSVGALQAWAGYGACRVLSGTSYQASQLPAMFIPRLGGSPAQQVHHNSRSCSFLGR